MEHDQKKKRGREAEEEEKKVGADVNKNAKKKQEDVIINMELLGDDHEDESRRDKRWDSYTTPVGVFDFPWLNEGIISKPDDWKLEDAFSSSLLEDTTTTSTSGFEFSSSCHSPPPCIYIPDVVKFEDNLESEEVVDSIWSSVLNQPLSTAFNN